MGHHRHEARAMRPEDVFSSDPETMSGALVFRGTRVPVEALFENLAGGLSLDEFLDNFPTVQRSQAEAALILAAENLRCIGDGSTMLKNICDLMIQGAEFYHMRSGNDTYREGPLERYLVSYVHLQLAGILKKELLMVETNYLYLAQRIRGDQTYRLDRPIMNLLADLTVWKDTHIDAHFSKVSDWSKGRTRRQMKSIYSECRPPSKTADFHLLRSRSRSTFRS
jgi:uncharacterized protein (DUF433 family)